MLPNIQPNIAREFSTTIYALRACMRVTTFFLLYFLFSTSMVVNAQRINSHPDWVQFVENDSNTSTRTQLIDETGLFVFDSAVSLTKLQKQDFTIYRRLAPNVVVGKREINSKTKNRDFFSSGFSQYKPNHLWKLSEELLHSHDDRATDNGEYWVQISDSIAFAQLVGSNPNLKIRINRGSYYLIEMTHAYIQYLIKQPFVHYIGLESATPTSEATVLDLNLHPNRINTVHHLYPNLKGQQEVLSLQEPLYDVDDIDLIGRYVDSPLKSDFIDNHATQMATIAVGAGNSFVTGEGVAGKAFHTSSDNSNIIPDAKSEYEDQNIQVQNHSYGTEIESFYGVFAALYDESTNSLPELLHVISSGNSGDQSATEGKYEGISGFANLTGNFKQAKNILTVGSVDTTGTPILFSSKGPAYDGRIKPELSAYSMAGTSNSAALVSGTAILLQQFYKAQYNSAMPAAFLKGLLINSADDVHNKGVDYSTGFGQLNALRAVENLENEQFFEGSVSHDEFNTFTLNVPADVKNLKITLIWNDPAANPNDEKALVNDLDLKVIDAQSDVVLPMVLNTTANESSLTSLATEGEDHLNNVEQVVIEAPESGVYQIQVNGFDVPVENQQYYVLYQWDIKNQFRWTSPTGSDNIPYNGETTSHLRWESSVDEAYGQLFYQLTSGPEAGIWQPIQTDVLLTEENYRWEAPDVNTLAWLKMVVGDEDFVSDTFSISSPLRLGVGFNCADSLMLQWQPVAEADQYEIATLKDNKLQTLSIIEDTTLVLSRDDIESNYFRVTPIVEGKRLIQSFTINYQLQGAGCFLKTFFVEAVQDSGILLRLELSASNGVQQVNFERLTDDQQWETITISSGESLSYAILDSNPNDGPNTYRINIEFFNGTSLQSEGLTTFFVKTRDFIVYPNPIRNNESLRVFSKKIEDNCTFQLISPLGELILESTIIDERSFIDLPVLTDGMYYYKIYQNKNILASGKIVIFQ